MKGRSDCPHCQGAGVVLDPDPSVPARICACTATPQVEAAGLGIPNRYQAVAFEGFWDWWKVQHSKDQVRARLGEARELLNHPQTRHTLNEDLASKLQFVVEKCGPGEGGNWRDVKPAQEPQGYRSLFNWARHGRERIDLWWIDGAPGSGRSSLAAAALRSWSEHHGKGGRFISVRALGQELKDLYYDTRNFMDRDFLSERDRMAPLLTAPCLVLDDLDRLDSDIRVVRAVAQLLDHRYAEELPTLITASRWSESLLAGGAELFSLARLEDPSLNRRLAQARRVILRPTLDRLLEALQA